MNVFDNDTKTDWGYGVAVSLMQPGKDAPGTYFLHTLLMCERNSLAEGRPVPVKSDPGPDGLKTAEMAIIPVALHLVSEISTLRICIPQISKLHIRIPQDLRPADNRRSVLLQLQELLKKNPEGLPQLDPVEDMGITEPELIEAARRIQDLETTLSRNEVFQAEGQATKFEAWAKRAALLDEAKKLKATLGRSQLTIYREESASRIEVLKRLQHINDEEVLEIKGKAACEIDSADELVTVELMFNGAMEKLDKHELVALVSCLVPVEKSTDDIKLTRQVAPVLAMLQAAARHVAEVSRECKLDVDVDEYVESFKPALMDVVYSWSKGKSFREVCLMTSLYEGSIVRAVRRLDELMQQLMEAAKVVGDEPLAAKILESNLTIRRDIIFSASLYV
ncbi:hypothetical protein FOA52_004954 [Chlamydomonas sp. UWO 241]|nr:hypothetical protein FOA52_004954 [Chlamydomonas sp. UWO 241]